MSKATFNHEQHPNQESKKGFATYASNTRVNYSTNDSRAGQSSVRASWWHRIKNVFRKKAETSSHAKG